MTAKRLRFTGPKTVMVESTTIPTPDADELLVRTSHSGISPGTELLVYRDRAPSELVSDETIASLDGPLSYPLSYGYAIVGEVIDAGADVEASWEGRRVFAFHPHASHAAVPLSDVHPVPEDVPSGRATLLPTVETAVNFLMDANPTVGERAVVFGQGPVGLCTTALLASHPLATLQTVEPLPHRRTLSSSFGADGVHSPEAIEPLHEHLAGANVDGADVTIELSGNPTALDDALSVTGYAGRVLVGSWYGERPASLSLGGRFHRSRIRLLSSQVSTLDPTHRGRWTKDRRIEVAWNQLRTDAFDPLLTHRIPFEEAPEAYRLLDRRPNEAVGVVLTYE